MEALECLKEYRRMCNSWVDCVGCGDCPLSNKKCLSTGILGKTDGEFLTITSIVEQWSKEHPIITNVQKFKEVFGVLPTDYVMGRSRETWWDKPYKEPEHDG